MQLLKSFQAKTNLSYAIVTGLVRVFAQVQSFISLASMNCSMKSRIDTLVYSSN